MTTRDDIFHNTSSGTVVMLDEVDSLWKEKQGRICWGGERVKLSVNQILHLLCEGGLAFMVEDEYLVTIERED